MGMQSLSPALSNIEGTRRSGFILADCNVQKAQHHHLAIMQNNDIEKSMKFATESCHKKRCICIVISRRSTWMLPSHGMAGIAQADFSRQNPNGRSVQSVSITE
jgi:hypothetical protein